MMRTIAALAIAAIASAVKLQSVDLNSHMLAQEETIFDMDSDYISPSAYSSPEEFVSVIEDFKHIPDEQIKS